MTDAAMLVQKHARGMMVRHAIIEAEMANDAAITIQSLFRGHMGRAEYVQAAQEHVDELQPPHTWAGPPQTGRLSPPPRPPSRQPE